MTVALRTRKLLPLSRFLPQPPGGGKGGKGKGGKGKGGKGKKGAAQAFHSGSQIKRMRK